jgi:two-component system, LytTR family, response regulator
MINCIIVDDEQHAIDIMLHYVKQVPHLNLIGTTTNPMEALELVTSQKVDLVFLDVQMPELSGIDFVKAINGKAKVILTTAYSEFALESYELDVVDYLLKPIRFPRFLQAVQKAAATNEASPQPVQDEDDYIFVKTESKGKFLKINLADIDYLEGMKNYVAIHCNTKKTLVLTSMKEMEDRLSKHQFIRVHKSFIIAINRINGIEGNQVLLKNVSAPVLIGDIYKTGLMELVKNKMIQ